MKILKVKNLSEGFKKAKELLYQNCNPQTALFLSGGLTPKVLYQELTKEQKIKVGSVALVDERFGLSMHDNSNEKIIEETGLFKYFESQNIPVFNILNGQNIQNSTKEYEGVVAHLLKSKNKIAILGIGGDGHIAGLPAGISNSKFLISNEMVLSVQNFPGEFKNRITLTFKALSQMDKLILLAFGQEKKKALELMLALGLIKEIPARFLNQKGISNKTILITDQKV